MILRTVLALSLALSLGAPALAADQDIDKVNGSITVDAGERFGDLQTVNGSIRIGANAQVGNAETVNGSIKLDGNVQASALTTVNGSIRLGEQVQVNDDVEAVNGSIFVDRGGNIRGDLGNVNGSIGLVDADIGGSIETVTGDLTVGAGSHVRGGIRYEKPGKVFFSITRKRDPRVIIGPNARVDGPLVFGRKVDLYVHSTAVTGPITGATAVRYEGARAPKE